MKVTIERDECISCGVCWSECPEVFEEDQTEGKSQIAEKYRVGGDICTGDVPESLRESAQRAADGCPVTVIRID